MFSWTKNSLKNSSVNVEIVERKFRTFAPLKSPRRWDEGGKCCGWNKIVCNLGHSEMNEKVIVSRAWKLCRDKNFRDIFNRSNQKRCSREEIREYFIKLSRFFYDLSFGAIYIIALGWKAYKSLCCRAVEQLEFLEIKDVPHLLLDCNLLDFRESCRKHSNWLQL